MSKFIIINPGTNNLIRVNVDNIAYIQDNKDGCAIYMNFIIGGQPYVLKSPLSANQILDLIQSAQTLS